MLSLINTFSLTTADQQTTHFRCFQGHDQQHWFAAKEVCDALGLRNSRDVVAKNLDDDQKGVGEIYTLGGPQTVQIVNESGLYTLLFRSSKPKAKEFRRWVTDTVLPSIRQHGGYVKGQEGLGEAVVSTLHRTIIQNALPALHYYDKLTQHDHWHGKSRQEESSEAAIIQAALKFDLPVSLMTRLTGYGVKALTLPE